jgi:threonine dehydratase
MAGSVCDALLVSTPGRITFAINSQLVARGIAVSDEAALAAVAFAKKKFDVAVEPGGAVALAALLEGLFDARDRTVVAVLSGGNIDAAMLERALATLPA